MAKLSRLKEGLDDVQRRLNEKTVEKVTIDDALSKGIAASAFQIGDRLEGLLTRILADTTKKADKTLNAELSTITREIISTINNTSGSISGQISGESSTETIELLGRQILAIGLQIDLLPKSFPLPKDTDLSGLSEQINALRSTILEIPKQEIPPAVDVTPQLKAMEKRMSKRIFKFDVIRDTVSRLIDKIVVTEK